MLIPRKVYRHRRIICWREHGTGEGRLANFHAHRELKEVSHWDVNVRSMFAVGHGFSYFDFRVKIRYLINFA